MRWVLLAALALAGCLDAPAGGRWSDGDDLLPPPTADLADADAPACDTAFAVAYVSQLSVRPDGGDYVGVLVIEALGAQVNLDSLGEGPDDGVAVELELSQPAFELTPPGLARGELDPAAETMILDQGLLDQDAWDGVAPTFNLRFDPVAELQPPVHVTADVAVGDSTAVLEFDIDYDRNQGPLAIPRKAGRVESACGE